MNDPYSVLGVSPSASEDEVKKAYHDLARKYHPDNYHDNPLADLAQEKMKEINEAYDAITKQRERGEQSTSSTGNSAYQGYSSGSAYQQSYTGANAASYINIRNLINAGNLQQAEEMLNGISSHDAEWNYLMGSVYWRKGWMDEAGRCFRTAATMNPGNVEYRNAVNYMNQGGQAYRPNNMGGQMAESDVCSCCAQAYMADCCCEMMGGDLIPCC